MIRKHFRILTSSKSGRVAFEFVFKQGYHCLLISLLLMLQSANFSLTQKTRVKNDL